jgi:hypothetical protein
MKRATVETDRGEGQMWKDEINQGKSGGYRSLHGVRLLLVRRGADAKISPWRTSKESALRSRTSHHQRPNGRAQLTNADREDMSHV